MELFRHAVHDGWPDISYNTRYYRRSHDAVPTNVAARKCRSGEILHEYGISTLSYQYLHVLFGIRVRLPLFLRTRPVWFYKKICGNIDGGTTWVLG